MNGTLESVVDYIYDNFRYGSKITENQLNELVEKFSLTNTQKEQVIEEFKMLDIQILSQKEDNKILYQKLCKQIGKSKIYRESLLNNWYKKNKLTENQIKIIRMRLDKSGYSIINDIPKEIDRDKFNFLNDLEFDSLDTKMESEEFKEKLDKNEMPPDSGYNLDYLTSLHSEYSDLDDKEKALNNLVEANIQLVWGIVDRYKGLATQSFDENDMFQNGMIGLMKAAEKFDLSKETQFSTYAVHWIRQSITRSIMDYSLTIRQPVHVREKMFRMQRTINRLEIELKRAPLLEEIGAEMDLLTEKVAEYMGLVNNQSSLNVPVGPKGDSTLETFLIDESIVQPDRIAVAQSLKQEFDNLLEKYPNREQEVINMRFGRNNQRKKTLAEIGQIYGVSRERIRQIESKTLESLKIQANRKGLREYYETP